jgi:glycine cleavage system T protein (aminomethyltransferase)
MRDLASVLSKTISTHTHAHIPPHIALLRSPPLHFDLYQCPNSLSLILVLLYISSIAASALRVRATTASSGVRRMNSLSTRMCTPAAATSQTRSFADTSNLERTALYDEHLKLKGTMVPFAGYALPVKYEQSVIANHKHVRESAGLFDVSHMGQLRFHGPDREKFVERVTVVDFANLSPHQGSLSVITNEVGGVKDDTVIVRRENVVQMVVNGACKHSDMDHFQQQIKESKLDVSMEYLDDLSLIALQGPQAAAVLGRLLPAGTDLVHWAFMTDMDTQVAGFDCTVTRCGYTGEDGFELSVKNTDAPSLWQAILDHPEVEPAGLGVRDSLRLEAGLCLYGNDLDETTTPIEAGLGWTVSKRRRAEGGFIGYEAMKKHMVKGGFPRKRVGFTNTGAPAREGAIITDMEDNEIGVITSGTFSPSLKKAISMGYLKRGFWKAETPVKVVVRGKSHPAFVQKMPFVPAHYYRVPEQ